MPTKRALLRYLTTPVTKLSRQYVNFKQSQSITAAPIFLSTKLSQFSQESIREIEETLNQQLFNIGMNDPSNVTLSSRDQQTINNIYDTAKTLDSVNNVSMTSNIFPTHFDTFDMSQITLQVSFVLEIVMQFYFMFILFIRYFIYLS